MELTSGILKQEVEEESKYKRAGDALEILQRGCTSKPIFYSPENNMPIYRLWNRERRFQPLNGWVVFRKFGFPAFPRINKLFEDTCSPEPERACWVSGVPCLACLLCCPIDSQFWKISRLLTVQNHAYRRESSSRTKKQGSEKRARVREPASAGWREHPGGWPGPGARAARTQYLSILLLEISIGCASSVFFSTLASRSSAVAPPTPSPGSDLILARCVVQPQLKTRRKFRTLKPRITTREIDPQLSYNWPTNHPNTSINKLILSLLGGQIGKCQKNLPSWFSSRTFLTVQLQIFFLNLAVEQRETC